MKNKLLIPLASLSLFLTACSSTQTPQHTIPKETKSVLSDYKYMTSVEAPHFKDMTYKEFMEEVTEQKSSKKANAEENKGKSKNKKESKSKNKSKSKSQSSSCIVYFGFPKCPWCEESVPVLNKVANDKNVDVYYVNKRSEVNKADKEGEKQVIEYLDKQYGLEKNDEGIPTLYVPEVVVIKDGDVISHHMGTTEKHDAKAREMTDEEKKELEKIYGEMIEGM